MLRTQPVPRVQFDARRRTVVQRVARGQNRAVQERAHRLRRAVAVGDVQSAHAILLFMHTIQPARLKPGVSMDAIRPPAAAGRRADAPVVRGTALIFWDLKVPGKKKKLDAIDTDQITPAADCVSESLDTLDERWKAGAFRYLMPDFRARVHRGETFVVAGDRFAIGSSREMSPAGLK